MKRLLWCFMVSGFTYGALDRTNELFHTWSSQSLMLLMIALFFAICVYCLEPEVKLNSKK